MEIEIRLECLKLASERYPGAGEKELIQISQTLYDWVLGDEKD
jgi:hypothetical protein